VKSRTRKAVVWIRVLAGRSLSVLFPIGFVALAATGCSGGNKESARTPPVGNTNNSGGPASTTLEVAQNDYFFQPNKLTASPGHEVTVEVTNKGSNVHNLRIAGPDGEFETEDDAVIAPADEGGMKPGDTRSLQWVAPARAGTIRFRCDFHPTQMNGTITVGG